MRQQIKDNFPRQQMPEMLPGPFVHSGLTNLGTHPLISHCKLFSSHVLQVCVEKKSYEVSKGTGHFLTNLLEPLIGLNPYLHPVQIADQPLEQRQQSEI